MRQGYDQAFMRQGLSVKAGLYRGLAAHLVDSKGVDVTCLTPFAAFVP